ncbi:MAG: tRNA uridine-5-carboxymethylaminomethyl(34) synthesis GTPase MnmE [Ruminococcaceae bacterium]|nr:tRNA uridine-5-carboxymethylaminomethyl(34) synthesis GTPase MnmE [Oscillospiraceae bacterium]
MQDRTIAAISTPFGRGGIAVIRISGVDAIEISSKVFKPRSNKSLTEIPHGRTVYGLIVFEEKTVDDGMASVFKAPNSFTGEDTVEISCHGGILITQKVLEAVLAAGASPAAAGEFTKRAFVSGKIKLTEAEAVIATINAESEEQLKLARSHMEGSLSREIGEISSGLLQILSRCYVLCDYPDEDLSEVSNDEVRSILLSVRNRLSRLLSGYKVGHAVAEGIETAIVGRPNVGKSSLLNGLLGYQRAIVTDIPGTTRDTVEERLYLGRVLLKLCDTAGIRSGDDIDEVERIGIQRSLEKLDSSELVLAVFDSSAPLQKEDHHLLSRLKEYSGIKIAVLNKCDCGEDKESTKIISSCCFDHLIRISAKNKLGFEELEALIEGMYFEGQIDYSKTPTLSLARQKISVKNALDAVDRALYGLSIDLPADITGLDIENAISSLEELDGRQISEKIVSEIFSSFCVGK